MDTKIDWSEVVREMRDLAHDLYEQMRKTKDRERALKYWEEARALELAAEELTLKHLTSGGGY